MDLDINKIKAEINNRKKNNNERKNVLGEKIITKQTGDQFLKELMYSANTGHETNASVKVKTVDKLAESKINGTPIDPNLLSHTPKPNQNQSVKPQPQHNVRTAATDARIEEARRIKEMNQNNVNTNLNSNVGFSDAIDQYMKTPVVGAPMTNNGLITEQQMMERIKNNGGNVYGNNNMINEQVTKIAKDLLNENFGKLYAEAMKNSIIETYKAEVIREAINENRGFIEQIVRDTIIDLQKKAQSKK